MGSLRLVRECHANLLVCVVVFGSCSSLGTPSARAEPGHVENRCACLSATDYDELNARVLLLLRGEGAARPLPVVICDSIDAWVEWNEQRFDLAGRAPLVDEVVDIVARQLDLSEARDAVGRPALETMTVGQAQPVIELRPGTPTPPAAGRRADPVAGTPADARGGGVALGIETEVPSDTIGASVGPVFDFGSSAGPLLLGGREALRLSLSGRRVALMDFEAAIGYGAPLDPDARFGAALRFGAEWMVAYPEGNSGQAAVVPVVDLGLRTAHSFGLVGVWAGVDARFRTQVLALNGRETLRARDVGVSFTLGVAFVDWSRK